MILTVSRLRLQDYNRWKRVWDGNHPEHAQEGVRAQHLVLHPTDRNEVAVIREFEDLDLARRYHAGATRRQRMQDAGVVEYVDFLPQA